MAKLTLKPIVGAGNAAAGETAPAGSEVHVISALDLLKRSLREITDRELHDVVAVVEQERQRRRARADE